MSTEQGVSIIEGHRHFSVTTTPRVANYGPIAGEPGFRAPTRAPGDVVLRRESGVYNDNPHA